jgi:hypothetical protein
MLGIFIKSLIGLIAIIVLILHFKFLIQPDRLNIILFIHKVETLKIKTIRILHN